LPTELYNRISWLASRNLQPN